MIRLFKLKKYLNFDDFVSRNDIEILSIKDGVASRWQTYHTYKKSMQKITEKRVNQIIGIDYADLTKKLKKEFKRLHGYPWMYIFTSFFLALMVLQGLSDYNEVFIIFGFLFGIFTVYYSIVETIETHYVFKILKSDSTLTQDYIKQTIMGMGTLFYDVFQKVSEKAAEEDAITYKGPLK
jgi:hypothetical protein